MIYFLILLFFTTVLFVIFNFCLFFVVVLIWFHVAADILPLQSCPIFDRLHLLQLKFILRLIQQRCFKFQICWIIQFLPSNLILMINFFAICFKYDINWPVISVLCFQSVPFELCHRGSVRVLYRVRYFLLFLLLIVAFIFFSSWEAFISMFRFN